MLFDDLHRLILVDLIQMTFLGKITEKFADVMIKGAVTTSALAMFMYF